MRWHRSRRQFFPIETLETRTVMAGSIDASVDNGTLFISGDAADNHIAIYSGGAAGQVLVKGGTSTGDSSGNTSVNGRITPVRFLNVTNVVVSMAGGDDRVVVTDLNVPGNLRVTLGAGNDLFVVRSYAPEQRDITLNDGTTPVYFPVHVGGSISAYGGSGQDTFTMVNADIGNNLVLSGGSGNDRVQINGNLPVNVVGNGVLIDMGEGDDLTSVVRMTIHGDLTVVDDEALTRTHVVLTNLRVDGDVELDLSDRADSVTIQGQSPSSRFMASNVLINTGDGNDKVAVTLATVGNLAINAGSADDAVLIRSLRARNSLFVRTGSGDDRVTINTLSVPNFNLTSVEGPATVTLINVDTVDALLAMGAGNDVANISKSDFNNLAINFEAGDDRLNLIDDIVISNRLSLSGGTGLDTSNDASFNNSFIKHRTTTSIDRNDDGVEDSSDNVNV